MDKRFVTIFPASLNVHLLKDVGMVPYILHRDYGFDSLLVTFKNEQKYSALDNEVRGLKIHFIGMDPTYAPGKISFKVLKYIWNNARKIDVLNLYHNTKESLLYGIVYKIRNLKGVLYIKLDLNVARFEQCLTKPKLIGYSLFFKWITSLVSSELDWVVSYLHSLFPALDKKLIKITNGVDDGLILRENIQVLPFHQKEKLMIVVGRIGSPEKNHELLLKALKLIDLKDWSVAFIGPVEDSFQAEVNSFFSDCPALKGKVVFVGAIYERKALYEWYNRAQVFCLTSRWESFGIVLAEALYFGNYIVTTPVSSAAEITKDASIGSIVDNEKELATVLQDLIDGQIALEGFYSQIRNHARYYVWKDILSLLNERLEQQLT